MNSRPITLLHLVSQLEEQVLSAGSKLSHSERALAQAVQRADAAETASAAASAELEAAMQRFSRLESETKQSAHDLALKSAELKALQEKLDLLTASSSIEKDALAQQLKLESQARKDAEGRVASTERDLEQARARLAQSVAKSQHDSTQLELQRTAEELSRSRASVLALNSAQETLKGELSAARASLASAAASSADGAQHTERAITEIAALKDETDRLRSELQSTRQAFATEKEALETTVSDRARRLRIAEQNESDMKIALAASERQITDLTSRLRQHEAQLLALEQNFSSERSAAATELAMLRTTYSSLEQEHRDIRDIAAKQQSECERLQQQLDAALSRVEIVSQQQRATHAAASDVGSSATPLPGLAAKSADSESGDAPAGSVTPSPSVPTPPGGPLPTTTDAFAPAPMADQQRRIDALERSHTQLAEQMLSLQKQKLEDDETISGMRVGCFELASGQCFLIVPCFRPAYSAYS